MVPTLERAYLECFTSQAAKVTSSQADKIILAQSNCKVQVTFAFNTCFNHMGPNSPLKILSVNIFSNEISIGLPKSKGHNLILLPYSISTINFKSW